MQTYSTELPLNYKIQRYELRVIMTCFKRTFNYDFCVLVTAYPLGAPIVTEQKDLDDHHPLLGSLTDAVNLYEAFLETHLSTHQHEISEELIE